MALTLILSLFFGLIGVSSQKNSLQQNLIQRQTKINTLKQSLEKIKGEKASTEAQVKDRDQKLIDTQKQIDDLNKQLQAKAARKSLIAQATSLVAPQTVSAAPIPTGCGDNSYAHFIYMHESGCNLNAVNAGGCRGLGQACPGAKLPCGADYACQNAWFTNYANQAYGGWAGAYAFWLAHSWW